MVSKYEHSGRTLTAYTNCVGSAYPTRFHRELELVYIHEGTLNAMIDGKSFLFQTGDIYVVFPNILHSITAQNCRKTLIMASPTMIPGLSDTLSYHKPKCSVVYSGSFPPFLEALFLRCSVLYKEGDSRHVCAAHISSILHELLPLLMLEPRSSDTELVQQMVEYVMANYTEDISLTKMAQKLGYSQYHISRVIGDTFGCNFRTLVNSYRICAAEELLLNSAKTVSEIAYTCGFQNQSSFNRIFLKHCGVTPSQYRTCAGNI